MSTNPGKLDRVAQILEQTAALEGAARSAFLGTACGGDASLRSEVESLLSARDAAKAFLGSPTGQDVPRVGSSPLSEAMTSPGCDAATLGPSHESPGTLIGPYKLLQLIGEGGFGSVFMAEQERPVQRKVALKVIKLGMDTRQVVARFEQERQALALMDHPNIARVLDAGATETGRPFFVMELVKGDPIIAFCDKNDLSIDQRLDLFSQVCNAVQHAHTKGIIHRDIKPSNVLVSTQDGRPHAKVIDFGIAKATASKLTERTLFTEHKALIGTPEYMSPEQAEGSLDIDTRTDVYSLGVLLYELLTGTTPFSSKELRSAAFAEVQRIIREVEPPRPSTRLSANSDTIASIAAKRRTEPRKLGAIVRGELDWIVMKALEKDRQRRYETANSLAMDVRRYLAGEAVLAAPPSNLYRVRTFIRRNRVVVTAGGAVAVALLLGVTGTSVGLSRSRAWNRVVAGQRDTATAALASVAEAARARAASVGGGSEVGASEPEEGRDPVKVLADTTVRMIDSIDELRRAEADQREAAEDKRREAELARERADEIAAFLREILRAADPAQGGAQTTLVSVLRKSDSLFDARLRGQPEVELALRETIGQTYANLGLHRDALPHLQRALALAARVDVPPADESGQEGRFQWLQRWMQPVFKSCIAIGEADRVLVITKAVADELAQERTEDDPTVKLVRLGVEALGPAISLAKGTLQVPAAPSQPPAGSRPANWRLDRALKRLEERRGQYGESDLRTIDAKFDVAEIMEEPTEAEAMYAEALAAEALLRAPDDPARQRHQFQHAISRASRLGPADAVALLESALRESERVAGHGKVETIEVLRAIAGHQAELPDPEAQLRSLRAATALARAQLGAAHPTTLVTVMETAPLLAQAGEYAEAERLLRECGAAIEQGAGAASPFLAAAHGGLAHVLAAQGRHAEAVELLRPVIARMDASPGFGATQSFDPRSRLIESLIALGLWDEAAKELEWFAADPSAESPLPQSLRRHGARLWARLYEQRSLKEPGKGFDEEAAHWRATAGRSP